MRQPIPRVVIAIGGWGVLSTVAVIAPVLLLVGWPLTVFAFLFATAGALEIQRALSHHEPVRRKWGHTALLGGLVAASIVGAVASIIPSMAWHTKSGQLEREYAMSVIVAPALWATILIGALRAFAVNSPRRRVLAGVIAIGAWPILIAIRALREPFIDLDNQFAIIAPHVIELYVGAVSVVGGIGLVIAVTVPRANEQPPASQPARAVARRR